MNYPSLADVNPALPPDEIIRRIEEALARDGTHTWEDVKERLVDGAAQIFWNEHGAWITEIMISPQRRWLNVWIVAGQLPGVMELQEQVERFALTNTLSRMVATAREGWLADKPGWEAFGWKKHAVMIVRAVEGV